MRKTFLQKIFRFFKFLYIKLVRINDTPQKVALGMGLGVFLGVFPGVGPIASVVLAVLFRVNRASALVGCLITNTWISFVTFVLAVKVGSALFGLDWRVVQSNCAALIKGFSFARLSELQKPALAMASGYILVSLAIGAAAYLATLIVIKIFSKRAVSAKEGGR